MTTLSNGLGSFLHSSFAFVIILVPLVVFHEFGHYIFARIFGVKAEIFSVGFGPKLWSKQMGETEVRLSAIPLGGYVKLLGDERDSELSPEDSKRALHRQKAWKRFFIFLGGPLFNFILAILIFMVILAVGEPQMASVAGRVVRGSSAEKVGFQSGDRIEAINGKPIKKFEQFIIALNESPNKLLRLSVSRANSLGKDQDKSKEITPVLDSSSSEGREEKGAGKKLITIDVTPTAQSGYSIYGESTPVGDIEGLLPFPRANVMGVSSPYSTAAQAGMETQDKIVTMNDTSITQWEVLERMYQRIEPGASFTLQFKKHKGGALQTATFKKPLDGESLGDAFGLYSSELFIDKTVPKSPASEAGIVTGDRLVKVEDKLVQSFFELKEDIQKSGEKRGKVLLTWERQGRILSSEIIPTVSKGRDVVLNKTTQYTIGVMPLLVMAEPEYFVERVWNPFRLVYQAGDRVISFSWRNVVSLRKMITGDVSVGNLGGPITIGKLAGESLTRGLVAFLTNMAIFSIGLGVLNILPVPVLDGGHLLLLGIESIRGKPLTIRQMEIIQSVGLLMILALMGIAFHNDIARLLYS